MANDHSKKRTDPIILMSQYPITESWVYFIVKRYSYAYNIKYFNKYLENAGTDKLMSKINEGLSVIGTARHKGYIKELANGDYKVTISGHWYLLSTHPKFNIWAAIISTLIGLGIFQFTCGSPSQGNSKVSGTERNITTPKTSKDSPASSANLPYDKDSSGYRIEKPLK